jgi:hypothetical protein
MQNTQRRKRTMKVQTFYLSDAMVAQISHVLMTSPSCEQMNKSDLIRESIARGLASIVCDDAQRAAA